MKTILFGLLACFLMVFSAGADDALPKAFIDGNGPGWKGLGEADFVNVNCAADTWSFRDGMIQCTGTPTGVMRMKEPVVNFELVIQWKHLKPAGNSGVFVWASDESIKALHADFNSQVHKGEVVAELDPSLFQTQVEQAKGGMGYMSASDPRIHFGLGKRMKVESLVITWPSGQVDRLSNAPIDQIIAVQEGKGIVPRKFPKIVSTK